MRTHAAAGGVIVNQEGKIALVEQHGNSWCLPKGGVEEGETLLETATREIREETGLTELTLLGELGSYERRSIAPGGVGETDQFGMRQRTFFLFTTAQADMMPQETEGEITATRWVTIDEALVLLTHPRDREFLESVRSTIESAVQ